jgi:diguanylate cyclase (GGDEF)-like protein
LGKPTTPTQFAESEPSMIKSYVLQNWTMLLILAAFAIALRISVFLDKKTLRRMYVLIAAVFLLSITVFMEFNYANSAEHRTVRIVLTAVRYSATPFIIAQIAYTLVKKQHWCVFIPAMVLTAINFASIPTGIVFGVGEDGEMVRGVLGYLPFIVSGGYCLFLIGLLLWRSNERLMEIVPIVFLGLAFASGLVFPFIYGKDYSTIFCSTIAAALFVYYVFSILEQTKKDALTGLLNRQAFKSDICENPEEITALLSIDMNGLKTINDDRGHAAGDDALTTLAVCFMRSLKSRESGYRIGGDEFAIVCRRTSQSELMALMGRIEDRVDETEYSCSMGYSYNEGGEKTVEEMLKEADDMMYSNKARYYLESGRDRRRS